MLSLYDLLGDGHSAADVLAWAQGREVNGLPRLSAAEARALMESWDFGARPGQKWAPGVEFITDFESGRGFGKAVSLATPLPTPTGWTTMGAVQVGDMLLDEQGRPCRITSTHDVDATEAWRLRFSDGEHVDACGDHLWVTIDMLERKRMCRHIGTMMHLWAYSPPRTTREVVATLTRGPRGDTNHCIPLAAPLALPDANLPMDPYALGVWLGDGDTAGPAITSHVDDAPHYEARFVGTGIAWRLTNTDARRPHVGRYHFGEKGVGIAMLRAAGVLGNKHIPAAYLRASYPQRLALMQGLIDTDGTIDKGNGQIEFCSMLEHLAEQVAELARTLGQKASVHTGRAMLKGVDHGTKYRVYWRPTLQMASLPRKAALMHRMGSQSIRNSHRMIVGAEPLPPQRMRCVTVDSPARMYLCGRGMIPTHNTTVGGETINDLALSPETWGGYACVVGPDPTEVLRDPLFGKAGIFAAAERRERAGLGPGIRTRNLNQRILQFEAPRGGGGGGLTVHWAASSDPKSVHGLNVGFAWLEEFGVWYHRKQDEQGNNAWQALRPAIRLGLSKVMITQTPSRSPEVRRLQRDAERPECPACRAAYVAAHGRWRGEVGKEPWRLPTSPQLRLHPLLNTRTTVPARECPACGGAVVADVRCVFGDTTDNPTLSARARADAASEVATGSAAARNRFAPRGEVDSGAGGTLVRHEDVLHIEAPYFEEGRTGPVRDRWLLALAAVGAEEVVVDVDPATTATASSDETGVVAAARRQVTVLDRAGDPTGESIPGVVLLEDASVRPADVEHGAPSSVWAPRAYRRAVLWDARRIIVETNQGGDEVLSAVQDLVRVGLTEATARAWLAEEMPEVGDPARFAALARRLVASARRITVQGIARVSSKQARTEWYGRTAAQGRVDGIEGSRSWGRQAVLCCTWLGGALHWQPLLGQVTGYEPPREGGRRERPRKDRYDAGISAAQELLGVVEASAYEVREPGQEGWMAALLGDGPRGGR